VKKKPWNPGTILESLKRMLTKNIWLKILSVLLASATYFFLADKTDAKRGDIKIGEAELYDTLKKYMLKPDNAGNTEKSPAEKKVQENSEQIENQTKTLKSSQSEKVKTTKPEKNP
jgi:hypothetical protein